MIDEIIFGFYQSFTNGLLDIGKMYEFIKIDPQKILILIIDIGIGSILSVDPVSSEIEKTNMAKIEDFTLIFNIPKKKEHIFIYTDDINTVKDSLRKTSSLSADIHIVKM